MGLENMTKTDSFFGLSGQIHFVDIIISAIIAFGILFVYSAILISIKRSSLKKFWQVSLTEFTRIKKDVAIPTGKVLCALNKLKRTEILVSEIFNQEKFHDYMDNLDYLEQALRDPSGDMKYKIGKVEEWLNELILSV